MILAKRGEVELQVRADDGVFAQGLRGTPTHWDAYSLPAQVWRTLRNTGSVEAYLLLLTAGDEKKTVQWAPDIVAAAAAAGWSMDANDCMAPTHFVDRSQR